MTCKWLRTMVSKSLFPFQMAFSWLINRGYYITTYKSWDDPPSRWWFQVSTHLKNRFDLRVVLHSIQLRMRGEWKVECVNDPSNYPLDPFRTSE